MPEDAKPRPTQALTSAQPDEPIYADKHAADQIFVGASDNYALADVVAAKTETPEEAEIDLRNGLRRHAGRRPTPEDFEGLLTPEGNSGDIVGSEIRESTWVFGEDGTTKVP